MFPGFTRREQRGHRNLDGQRRQEPEHRLSALAMRPGDQLECQRRRADGNDKRSSAKTSSNRSCYLKLVCQSIVLFI